MVPESKRNIVKKQPLEHHNGNAKLWAVIRKKGERDLTSFKKAFGKDADLPSLDAISYEKILQRRIGLVEQKLGSVSV